VHRQEYYAIITHMDAQIGRILDALKATGQADNTHIVFTADHGLAVGQHGLLGKQNMYDHSMRVPLTLCGPGIPEGEQRDTPVYLQDVMATSLDWAGVSRPDHVAFKSLTPLISDPTAPHYDAIYGAYMDRQRMVADDGFKLIHYPKIDTTLLFNLREDPLEMNDVSDDPAHAATKQTLWATLKTLQQETGDRLALRG
jgi:arylsulfatase A-like enzyme